MEEKINNKRIFSYVPSIIARIILESEIKDEDVFFNKSRINRKRSTLLSPTNKQQPKFSRAERYSIQTNPDVFPLEYPLSNSIIMSVKLKGFQELVLHLGLNDPKMKKAKLHCEYFPILTSKILLQISSIITENGGEILKMDDFEFYAIWDFSNIDLKFLHQYQYFYSKHAIISAYDIMKKVDNIEIIKGHRLKVSIGISYGETSIFFFGGERRRSDYVIMGEAIEESELCLNQSGPHEIIIGREINNFFKGKGEIATEQVGIDDKNKNIYKINIENTDEYELKNFQDFKNIKLNSNYIIMNQKVYQNLSKKVYMLSSVLPQGLVKYLDIGEDENLKELSIITIMTVHIIMDLDLIDNCRQIQYLIRDMQKATYLTRGSLLGVIKTYNGLLIRCAWGLEPNTFVDETARAISTSFVMKKLVNIYKVKISIGIATGCCFTGLINIQGNRKMYSLLGYKAIISRLLADKANRKNMRSKYNNSLTKDNENFIHNFIVYCDKDTVKHSQKWYRYNYINDLYMFNLSNNDENNDNSFKKEKKDYKKNVSENKDILKNSSTKRKRFKTISNKAKHYPNLNKLNNPININQIEKERKKNYEQLKINNAIKIDEIYSPIEYDEYFFQTTLDPFPLIRTYKYNSHNTKKNAYSFYNYLNYNVKNDNDAKKNNNNSINNNSINNETKNTDINNIKIIKNDINEDNLVTRHASRTMYIKRKAIKTGKRQDVSQEIHRSNEKKDTEKFIRIDSRFDSIKMKPSKKKTRKEEKNIYAMINKLDFNKNKSKDYKSLVKLKKSQNIIGVHNKVELLFNFMNKIYINKEKQFFLIRGPLGIGKSLFIRKVLNNYIGLNDTLGTHYYNKNYQFLFCNSLNPFTTLLPYNTISLILRKIYLLLKLDNKINDLLSIFTQLSLDNNAVNNINFILSMGKNDINLINDFHFFQTSKKSKLNIKKSLLFNVSAIDQEINTIKLIFESVITQYEGPFNYENIDKINTFFYEMIKIYFNYLKSKANINNFILPLIFILDDIQLSDKYSINFIEFLYNKIINDKNNIDFNPFIFIMIQQTPFNKKHRGLSPIDLDKFLNEKITFKYDSNYENKIICLDLNPIFDNNILKKIVIFHFKDWVFKQYGTELKVVDNKIIDFLLIKSFNGIPFLVVKLLKSLINSDKFIQILSGELIITSELKDESDIMDWNDILIPYIYEKIASNSINKILNFREHLILKYASIIGTMFDIKTLDKINPLNSIIKIEDIINLVEKLNKEYFAELYNVYNQTKKNKLICQITFPFLRESLYQKFLMDKRGPLHMKLAGIISMSKRIVYFSLDDEIKMLKKHLFNSEINIINELKINKTQIKTTKDILQSKKDLSFNNLKILLIKEICHNFYRYQLDNLLDGNLEMFISKKNWIRVYYVINTKKIIFYNQEDEKKKKEQRHPLLILGLNSIYRNELSSNYFRKTKSNILEVCVSEEESSWTKGFSSPRKKKEYFFSSEKIKDVYQLEIGINFLKMKVNYDNFIDNFGSTRFPLYKLKWFVKKEEKYYFDSENSFNLWNINSKNKTKKKKKSYTNIEKIIDKSKECTKPFTLIITNTLGLIFALIQENIANFNHIKKHQNNNNSYNIQTPHHIKKIFNKVFYLNSFINKATNYSNNKIIEDWKKSDGNKSNISTNKIDDIIESNIKSMKKNINNISNNNSLLSNKFSNCDDNNMNEKEKTVEKQKQKENQSFNKTNKVNIDFSLKLNNSLDNFYYNDKILKNDNNKGGNKTTKFFFKTAKKNNNINNFFNENKNNNILVNESNNNILVNENNKNIKNREIKTNYEKYFYIPKISFPKHSSSQVKKIILEEEEPIFTESNFNTSHNASFINGNDSTKLTCSTNKKSSSNNIEKNINESTKGKNKIILEDNLLGSSKGLENTNISNNKIKKKNKIYTQNVSPFNINDKKT